MKWISIFVLSILWLGSRFSNANNFEVKAGDPTYIDPFFFNFEVQGGDTIFILTDRKQGIIFDGFEGDIQDPIVISNGDGLVDINDEDSWSGIQLRNCQYLKISGSGSDKHRYGLKLAGSYSGVNVSHESSNIEIEYVEIDHPGFAGIQVKDDYRGKPPSPLPVFKELVIHDCFIRNVSEGMYLGETKSPGMEFSYVRIFNNVIIDTKREGIQLANMVEDVLVYNNIVVNSGLDMLPGQGNCIQLGDNTVADVFNNILDGAVEFGIIVFGSGHINIYNNYISNCNGIFIDNRMFTEVNSVINISSNYFKQLTSEEVIRNYNEINELLITKNRYGNLNKFYVGNCPACTNVVLSDNIEAVISMLDHGNLDKGIFVANSENDLLYKAMGPTENVAYAFNSWPEFEGVQDFYIDVGTNGEFIVKAFTHDDDELELLFYGLPDFVTVRETGNGIRQLHVDARNEAVEIYPIDVVAVDKSHGVEVRKSFHLVVRKPDNRAPEINVGHRYAFDFLAKHVIPISVTDADDDEMSVRVLGLPGFMKMHRKSNSEYELRLQAGYSDVGTYFLTIIVEDGFSGSIKKELEIEVNSTSLEPGTIVYRINFGGPELLGEPINWQAGNSLLENYTKQWLHHTGSYSWRGINSSLAPDSLFGPFCYLRPNTQRLNLLFNCDPKEYQVKLFFSQQQADFDSIGSTAMQVFAEGQLVLNEIVLDDRVVNRTLVTSFKTLVLDSILELSIIPIQNFVKVHGLEISVAFPFVSDETDEDPYVFPNPFINEFYIRNIESDPILEWEIYNSKGESVYKGHPLNYFVSYVKVEMQNLKSGLYFISIRSENMKIGRKIIKF